MQNISHCTDLDSDPYCTGQESESESVPESVSSNVNEPLGNKIIYGKRAKEIPSRDYGRIPEKMSNQLYQTM